MNTAFQNPTQRWQAVRHRDPAADGHFVYGVRTTGIFCRPSCPSKPARREHVVFHDTAAEALRAGFRPCLRCRPDAPPRSEREAALVADACRSIESCESAPKVAELAARSGLGEQAFQRAFKRVTGLTPRAYRMAHRKQKLEQLLTGAESVTSALYEAGFGSSGRFYESAQLGMAPAAYRNGAAGEEIWQASRTCSLGRVLVAATRRGICAILLGDSHRDLVGDLKRRFPRAALVAAPAEFPRAVDRVVRQVERPQSDLALPLDIRGTVFQRRVWEALKAIPAGTTQSYSEIAARLGMPGASRAVAAACAANPLAVAIPCHRARAADGSLAGYRWGLQRKRRLIEREKK